MSWQIQAKLKTGYQWEPISVEKRKGVPGVSGFEREFQYNTVDLAVEALKRFLTRHSPIAHGGELSSPAGILADYDLRFAEITRVTDANHFPELREFFPEEPPQS